MNTIQVSDRTKKLIQEYKKILNLPDDWEQNLSISEYLNIRKFAIDELKDKVIESKPNILGLNNKQYVNTNKGEEKQKIVINETSQDDNSKKEKVIEKEILPKDEIKEESNPLPNNNTSTIIPIENNLEEQPFINETNNQPANLSKEERELLLFSQLKE